MRLLLLLIIIQITGFGQEPLQFLELGFEPSYCRTQPYQSGNGVVYAAAIGGQPDYTYLWYDHTNQTYFNNSTVGGLNPGFYSVKVFDSNGDSIQTTIHLDSLAPEAQFSVFSNQLISNEDVLIGESPANVEFTNITNSQTIYSPWIQAHESFKWKIGENPWSNYQSYEESNKVFSTIHQEGEHEVCLMYETINQCRDTTCKLIQIVEPWISSTESKNCMIVSSSNQLVHMNDTKESLLLFVFNTQGSLVLEIESSPGLNTIDFYQASANYIAKVVDPVTGEVIESFQFHF